MPSTSLGLRPASRIALRTASTAIARVERLDPREYSVSPTPTMQYLSFRLMSDLSSETRLRSIPRARIDAHDPAARRLRLRAVHRLVRLPGDPRGAHRHRPPARRAGHAC